jgi:peptide/nickel transport system substrate-binding protein
VRPIAHLATRLAIGMLILAAAVAAHAQEAPRHGGSLTIAYDYEAASLATWRSGDTNTHLVYMALYDSLVNKSETGEISPSLAHSWEVSDDRRTYTFHLHEGVSFHNGVAFDADVVALNFERWTDPPAGALNALTNIESVRVVDAATIEVTLETPDNQFLILLGSRLRGIVEPGAVEELDEGFGRAPVGTGPFKFVRWLTDSEIVLERNDAYWQVDEHGNALPYLDELVFRVIPQSSSRHTALVTGSVDVDTTVAPENVADLEERGGFEVLNIPAGYVALRLRVTEPPLDDVRVRQAISWAVDREAINEAIYFGLATPGDGLFSPVLLGYEPGYHPYRPRDLDLARSLLVEAGYPDGFSLDVIASVPLLQAAAELVQAQLAEIGINVNIQLVERGVYLDGIVAREWEAYIDQLTGRTDPAYFFQHLSCDFPYNGHDYCNPEIDQLTRVDGVAEFASLTDPARVALYQDANRAVMEDAPLVVLVYRPTLFAWDAQVQGIAVNPVGRAFWERAWIAD